MRRTGWEAFCTMVVPLASKLMSGTRSWEAGMVMLRVVLGKVTTMLPRKLEGGLVSEDLGRGLGKTSEGCAMNMAFLCELVIGIWLAHDFG